MTLLKIEDLQDGAIQISLDKGDSVLVCEKPIPFQNPLPFEAFKDLIWYLEEYLEFPYGAERYKAEKIEQKMKEWGELLFNTVFQKCNCDPDPLSLYKKAEKIGLDTCEVCITSEKTPFLMIPWELLRDPEPGRYLALSSKGLYRQRAGKDIDIPSTSDPFRILLVISRPEGEEKIPLQTVARPVLEAIKPFRQQIELDVLRPPTFENLAKTLRTHKGYYQVVHFDGHGSFGRTSPEETLKGYLAFEKNGKGNLVSSEELGQVLTTCKVPLFVLNACKSAQEGRDPYASVASQLVASGARGVVAMSYSVYSTAAAVFMKQVYESLVCQEQLSEAITAGRMILYANPERDSVVGPLRLRDWMVPVLYQKEPGYTPVTHIDKRDISTIDRIIQYTKTVCPEGQFGFIGRDYDILRIERALYHDECPWVLVSGIGGTGKTALAYGFARWYAETGGCPGGVFVTSFTEKAGFGQVVGSFTGFGTDFSQFSQEEQFDILVEYCRENPCLIIWDNFEPVAGYPEGKDPLASLEEQETLSQFLKRLKGGKTRVIITTRKPDENWLKIGYELLELQGLNWRDAAKLAESILKTVGRKPENFKDDPDYSRLLEVLRGHPRSLEVVIPHLRDTPPGEIINGLQHYLDELEDVLDASLMYVFPFLSERVQKHLPVIGLFASYVQEGVLNLFSDYEQYKYKEVMGEAPDEKTWNKILTEAVSVGLLRSRGGVYEIHPTLPLFLRQKLVSLVGEDGLNQLDNSFMELYGYIADSLYEDVRNSDHNTLSIIAIEEANLLRALHLAETNEKWAIAQAIVQTLCEFYECRGQYNEWYTLRTHVLDRIEYELPEDADRDMAYLWMFLLGDKANTALRRGNLESAKSVYEKILDYLISLDDPAVDPKIAVLYHQLGYVAQDQHQFDEAEKWYKKALEIKERLGLERDAARTYHQLGYVAQDQHQFDEAVKWYKKALEIFERLGLERDAADTYHQLGRVAQDQHQFDEAEKWYKKALEIFERLGLERDAADTYHQLGRVAQDQHQFDEAVKWYKKALEIFERLGLERDAADTYHNLGAVAQDQHQFDEAEKWYKKALEIKERLGYPPLQVNTLAALSFSHFQQNQFPESVPWLGKALHIALEYQMDIQYTILVLLGELLKTMGKEDFTTEWRKNFNEDPPLEEITKAMEAIDKLKKE
ncbi:MAG: tetratricopeptide repeat protein [Candidatus Methanofastidiosia archaeon]|jgi:tetratricopeptide (TPR) repeat protein